MQITNYYCPKTNDFKVRGNDYSVEGEMHIKIRIYICKGVDPYGNTCKSEDVIKAEINTSYLSFPIVASYFDIEDYSNPIKEYIDDFFWDYYTYGTNYVASIHMRQNSVQLIDSIFSYSPDAIQKSFVCMHSFLLLRQFLK